MTSLLVIAVAGAGALGALLRYAAGHVFGERGGLPWGIVIVNVVGSLLAGLAVGLLDDPGLRLVIATGFCGGFTTFSTVAVDTVRYASGRRASDGRRIGAAIANVALTLVLGIGAAAAGFALTGDLG